MTTVQFVVLQASILQQGTCETLKIPENVFCAWLVTPNARHRRQLWQIRFAPCFPVVLQRLGPISLDWLGGHSEARLGGFPFGSVSVFHWFRVAILVSKQVGSRASMSLDSLASQYSEFAHSHKVSSSTEADLASQLSNYWPWLWWAFMPSSWFWMLLFLPHPAYRRERCWTHPFLGWVGSARKFWVPANMHACSTWILFWSRAIWRTKGRVCGYNAGVDVWGCTTRPALGVGAR